MRFLNLDLIAYGRFTQVSVDLSGGEHGLHLIVGANEAGKSTSMRAISCLLFGFPSQTGDRFLHVDYDRLRVGGTLQHSSGETLTIIRRKRNRDTLRGTDDATIVSPEALERMTGGLDRLSFENLFGLDHEKLTAAGEDIRQGKGLLGEALFAAGTGLAGLRKAKQKLDGQLDELFRPKGQNPTINRAITDFREAREALKKVQLPGEEWLKHDGELSRARLRAVELAGSLDHLRRQRDQTIRTRSAIPQVNHWRQIRDQMAAIGAVPRLPIDFGDRCRLAREDAKLADANLARAGSRLHELDAEIEALPPTAPVLEAEAEIDAIYKLLGAVEQASEIRARRKLGVAEHEHAAREHLRRLGRPPEIVEAEAFRTIRDDELAAIRTLGQQESGLRAERIAALRRIADHDAAIARAVEQREQLGAITDAEPLRRAIRKARRHGNLDERRSQALADLKIAERDLTAAIRKLPGWIGDSVALEQLEVPLEPTLQQFETEHRESTEEARRLADRAAAETQAIVEVTAQLATQTGAHDVPTEADLAEARLHRDALWKQMGAGVATVAGEDFERAIRTADEVSDRLRREADVVARKAEWIARIEAHRATAARLEVLQSVASERQRRIDQSWLALVKALKIAAQSPAELRAWLVRREKVLQVADQARAAAFLVDEIEQTRVELLTTLEAALRTLGKNPPPRAEGLSTWLDFADDLLNRHDRDVQNREHLDQLIADAHREAVAQRQYRIRAEEQISEWQRAWTVKLERLKFESDLTVAQVDAILAEIQALKETMIKYRGQKSQVQTIDRDIATFQARAGTLAAQLAPDLVAQPAIDQVRELNRRLKEHRAQAQSRTELVRQRETELATLREAETRSRDAVERLEQLCRDAGCESVEGLAVAEERCGEWSRLDQERQACEVSLMAAAAGEPLDRFARTVEQATFADLTTQIARIETDILEQDAELQAVKEAMGRSQAELRWMDGGDHSAEASEQAQAVLSRLRADVSKYATLRLAATVLQRGIDRYREKNQGPTLARASALFADLTGGSFAGLRIDDDEGKAILQGVRVDGSMVGISGMSDGSHDQLYLALRIASLEGWLRTHEPFPLIVDDILLNFDDRRSLAALRALADLSRLTQVLFFTHHHHLADLAQKHLPSNILFRHELADPCNTT